MCLINKKILSIFIFLCLMSSCSAIPPEIGGKWRAAYDGMINYYQGYPDYPITPQMIEKIPYASLRMKIGDGPAGLLILQEINNDIFTWVSADNAIFSIRNGRIIETYGLANNLTNLTISSADEKFNYEILDKKEFVRILSLSNPVVNSLKIKVNKKILGKEEINILGKQYKTLLIEETISNEYINWNYKNYFWIDMNTGFVWKSTQQIAPNVPPIQIEILKKPT
tara:strand:- start:3522 stop:4196 length:675 start_codon:yes stop_codon:yes gene_type:complete